MPGTGKGIYIKSNPGCDRPNASAEISNILYENIRISKAQMWAIWVGPQQQHEPGDGALSTCDLDYPLTSHCPTQGCVDFRNITFRNVFIDSPLLSPGVILGNETNPIQNLVFDNVQITHPGFFPWGTEHIKCVGAQGTAINSNIVPHCLTDLSSKKQVE